MQTLICLPGVSDHGDVNETLDALFLKTVAGVPLLLRVILTVIRAGASSVVLVHPKSVPATWLVSKLQPALAATELHLLEVDEVFDPRSREDWQRLEQSLEPRFLWMPWNYVTVTPVIRWLLSAASEHTGDVALAASDALEETGRPRVIERDVLLAAGSLDRYLETTSPELLSNTELPGIVVDATAPGVAVRSRADVRRAAVLLVRGSGKSTDGIHSKLNRWLSRPMVYWLVKTPVSANMVTWIGLPVVALSGIYFTKGHWAAYTMGALLYWFSVLLDEVDGMIARTKFEESPFGCWLETFVDYSSYFFLWSGISLGLYRQYGSLWLPALGILVMVLNVFIFVVLLRQRKEIVPADHPENFSKQFVGRLDADSGSLLSRVIRKVVHFPKRGVFCHYLVLFSVFGGLHILFGFVVTGAVATLFVALYVNRLFRIPLRDSGQPSVSV
ncbi:MAG: hypothetical protein BMS9Abin37_1432 [Acidobacteriota bacterium]|nr:MAG: hypothetical protein BMS9Abin37_1432 [Acidobacteriota bacterium]